MIAKCGTVIIGYGGMGGWHTQQLKTMEEINLLGVYDILPGRNLLAEEKGLHAYSSFEEVLNDPQVDLVTVAIPNDQHRDVCIQAMEAGKNVICEKPVALNSRQLQDMIDASKKNGVLFTVHQNRRWDEDFLTMKKIYDEGTLGPVFCTVSHVTNDEVDDGFKAIITFGSGLTAQVEVGTSNFINLPRWYMQGNNGTAVMPDWFAENGRIVMVSDWENRDAVPVVTAAGLTKTMAPRTDDTILEYPLPVLHSDVRDFYRNVAKAIRGEEAQLVTHEQVMKVMKVMEAAFRSADTNQVVTDIFCRSNRFLTERPAFQPPGSAFAFPLARWKAVFQKTIEKASGKA